MTNYYKIVEGNLRTGDIAKSSDINHIQIHVQDMNREMNIDFHDGESYILGSGDKHANDFILTAAPKVLGRYIDDRILFEVDSENFININRYDVKQPILLTKTSIYSVIIKLKNSSNKDIPVDFELQDEAGNVLRSNKLVVPKNTIDPSEFEVVFDLDYYPTAPNLMHNELSERDGKDIPPKTDEESYDEGFKHDHENEEELEQFSVGVSKLYFVIKRTNLNEIDLVDEGDEPIFDPDNDLGVFYTEYSPSPEKNIYCMINSGTRFEETGYNIWFKEVYANEQTYLCTGGEAIIGGEKVHCIDTHISIEGGNSYGNVVSYVYLGLDGHLYFRNSQASMSTDIEDFKEDLSYRMPAFFLPIAIILTYSNVYGIDKEPLILQSQEDGQRPVSHHERLRRLEKKSNWIMDFAVPSRLKYTLTGEDWVDKYGSLLFNPLKYQATDADGKPIDIEHINDYFVSTDSQGNPIIRLSTSVVTNIPVTLKENAKDKDGNDIVLAENDILNASYFSSLDNMILNTQEGTLTLNKKNTSKSSSKVATTSKEAKETKYNPWDDYKGNRPASSKLKKHEREFEVIKGKNGRNDYQSEFPAMTFYTKSNYKMKKLTIPIFKFKNCSGIKFFIWKRQNPNNKKNTVWLEKKIYTSDTFSLKKAKTKGKYQYMEKGFTISFGKNGLSLPKGQYVIICLPIPKSGEGSVFVETYEPQNPKDFLIRYHGAANASHFLLKSRYPEIWYNDVEATVEEEGYYAKGVATSKTVVWNESGLEKIETIKPIIGKHITVPDKCSYKIFANTGADWQELTPEEDTVMNGGSTTFQWKIEFYGNGKDSPLLKYNADDGYAIQFVLTRAKAGTTNTEESAILDKNMCLSTIPFDAKDILRQYLGDNNLGYLSAPFNQYEFARIWAEKSANKKLLIDIQGADRYISNSTAPLWTYHYCDLTLDDFNQNNVDYSDYTESVEYDENNLRLKLDSNHSYNDNDIKISSLNSFTKVPNQIDEDTSTTSMKIVPIQDLEENQVLIKTGFNNYHDLTKYTGLRFRFETTAIGEKPLKINGLGIYISNTPDLDSAPTNKISTSILDGEEVETLTDTNVLPETLSLGDNQISKYKDKVIELVHELDLDNDGNKAPEHGYYKYVAEYSEELNQMIYKLQQIHDVKPYNLYRIGEISTETVNIKKEEEITVPVLDESGEPKTDGDGNPITETQKRTYGEYVARIEIDPNSQNLKYAREIGIVTLNDEEDYNIVNEDGIELNLIEINGISEDYYPIFSPNQEMNLFKTTELNQDKVTVNQYNALQFNKDTFDPDFEANDTPTNLVKDLHETDPYTTQICIKYGSINTAVDEKICYMNNIYDGGLSNYNHLGIQLATDVYIPKDCLKINLCEKADGEGVFASVNIPTLNSVYHPKGDSNSAVKTINLSQIFKKINSNKSIKSISITATDHFTNFLNQVVDKNAKGDCINLFLGKIVLYKAETIPMFHQIMRFKLYSTTNGKIDHTSQDIVRDSINIRKIGTIVDYN